MNIFGLTAFHPSVGFFANEPIDFLAR